MQTLAHIFYSGTVQGVGFRFTTQRFAQALRLTGWARNLPDGRVEIMVEGSQDQIEQLLKDLDQRFDGSIRNKEVQFGAAGGNFKDFSIRV